MFDLKYQNQFLFGDSILVAPTKSTDLTTDVYLLAGDWYRFSSDEKCSGGQIVTVDSPLTDLPVFIKAGAIIPTQNIIQSTNEKGDGTLEMHVWYGNEASSFIYYEDDGTSYGYENGAYFKREISFNPDDKTIRFSAVEGSFISKYGNIKLVLHGFGQTELKDNSRLFENSTRAFSLGY